MNLTEPNDSDIHKSTNTSHPATQKHKNVIRSKHGIVKPKLPFTGVVQKSAITKLCREPRSIDEALQIPL